MKIGLADAPARSIFAKWTDRTHVERPDTWSVNTIQCYIRDLTTETYGPDARLVGVDGQYGRFTHIYATVIAGDREIPYVRINIA